jgi:excisionase family DNA binding protein
LATITIIVNRGSHKPGYFATLHFINGTKKPVAITFFLGTILPTLVVVEVSIMTEFIRPKEVAERLGVSKHTVIRMVERGELDGFRVAHQYRIHRESVERLITRDNERQEQ